MYLYDVTVKNIGLGRCVNTSQTEWHFNTDIIQLHLFRQKLNIVVIRTQILEFINFLRYQYQCVSGMNFVIEAAHSFEMTQMYSSFEYAKAVGCLM